MAIALSPGVLVVVLDFARRRSQLMELTREAWLEYAARAAFATLAWALLVVAAARREGALRWVARAWLATAAFLAVGTQSYTWARYATYLNPRIAKMGGSLLPNFHHALFAQRLTVLLALLPPVLVAFLAAWAVTRVAPPRAWFARSSFAFALATIAWGALRGAPNAGWDNGAPPDVLWVASVGALGESRRTHEDVMTELRFVPQARDPMGVPPLDAHPSRPRSVVMIVNESVRAKDYCSVYDPACATNVFTNAELPRRFGLREMRAVDSTTAISIAVMWSGLEPTASRRALHEAPLVWEYAHAAGIESGYWTAQNLLFANAGRWLDGMPVRFWVTGTELEPYATYQCGADDGKAMDVALRDIATLREPYFAVVQLSNTHFPYWIDDDEAPFSNTGKAQRESLATLATMTKDEAENARLYDRYRDSILRQDKAVMRFVRALRARPGGDHVVVVYASDHGEQLGEYKEIGHANSMHDVELHVPMWVDAPPGTLAPNEEANLRAIENEPRTQLDVMPTLLDLLGLWDAPNVAPFRATMSGESLLRGGTPSRQPVVVTNCSEIFWCATKNWGALSGTRKLATTQDEGGPWRCHDLAIDPDEKHDLGEAACADLRALAEGSGRGKPW